MKIKRFNESLRDKMIPKSEEELDKIYNKLVNTIFSNKNSRHDIMERYVMEVYKDPDHFQDGMDSLMFNIMFDLDYDEFERLIKEQLKKEIYGN